MFASLRNRALLLDDYRVAKNIRRLGKHGFLSQSNCWYEECVIQLQLSLIHA
jgi:hypothetical protein